MLIKRLESFALYGAEWVLYLLLGLSVITVALILYKIFVLIHYRLDSELPGEQDYDRIKDRLKPPIRDIFEKNLYLDAEIALETTEKQLRDLLGWGLTFLGTVGSNAPFIGLFGTVIGVINAFYGLANRGAMEAGGVGAVMSGIAEALVATGVGLFVAIPSVIAYNHLSRAIGCLIEDHLLLFRHIRSLRKVKRDGSEDRQY